MSIRFNPDIHHRKTIRLRGYDYSRNGVYYITVCSRDRECLFGDVLGGTMRLNGAGRMIQSVWKEIPQHYPDFIPDSFIVMPNHVHGIIIIDKVGAGLRACPKTNKKGHPQRGAPTNSLFDIVYAFKSMTTTFYRHGVKTNDWPPFNKRLWQRNYYEHIIRNEKDLNQIRNYIEFNPIKWEDDPNNPGNIV